MFGVKPTIYERISGNKRMSIFLIFIFLVFVGFLSFVFYLIFENIFVMFIVFVFGALFTVAQYYAGTSELLTIVQAYPSNNKILNSIVEQLAIGSGIPVPEVYIIPDKTINAFASGRDPQHAVIAVTEGALEKLNKEELEGVVAHEISHIKNYDIRVMMIAAVLVAITVMISQILLRSFLYGRVGGNGNRKEGGLFIVLVVFAILLAIFSPLIARIIQYAVSRKREYLADSDAAMLTKNPEGLANALKKIKLDVEKPNYVANQGMAHLFISNPLKEGFWSNLFSTHPPIDERIKILETM
ncbi:MAG: M48 family metallopeptidase [archaeon]